MASQQQFSGRTVAGRYRLGPRRGSGVDAAVFDAFDEREQQVVSLKVVHPDICANPAFADKFDETMRTAAGLHEPHLARILDWGSDRWKQHEARYVTVEQLTGGSLRDVLDRGRTLSASQTLSLGLDVLRGLDVIHRAGLVHGDVRPTTIVFGDDRVPRLIDVGLGQLLAEVLWADAVHVSNDRAMYVAPEMAGEHRIEPKSDVYSLCLTMLEGVTGKVPFVGDSTVTTLSNRMNRLLPVSADLGPLAAVLERAGRPDPEGRSSVPEFGQALVRAAERLPRPAPIPVLGAGLFDLDEAEATRRLARPAQPPEVVPEPVVEPDGGEPGDAVAATTAAAVVAATGEIGEADGHRRRGRWARAVGARAVRRAERPGGDARPARRAGAHGGHPGIRTGPDRCRGDDRSARTTGADRGDPGRRAARADAADAVHVAGAPRRPGPVRRAAARRRPCGGAAGCGG